jgi:hypothetical protein
MTQYFPLSLPRSPVLCLPAVGKSEELYNQIHDLLRPLIPSKRKVGWGIEMCPLSTSNRLGGCMVRKRT